MFLAVMSYFCRPVEHYPFFLVSPHLFLITKLLKELNFITVSFCPRSCCLIERLIKDDILTWLDFFDSDYCIDCIKGKYAKQVKKSEAKRSAEVLEIIYTDICDLFPVKSVDGFDSFITFTDDFLRYGYIYPIKERSEAVDKFKVFKAEVENQHNIKIKIVRSDRGGSTTVVIPHMAKFLDLLRGSYKKMA
jgi:hypothetical protein